MNLHPNATLDFSTFGGLFGTLLHAQHYLLYASSK